MRGKLRTITRRGFKFVGPALIAAALLPAGGCIRSKVHITSEPEGAEVIWRGQPYGATPVSIPFIWYWHHDIALEKPGYERFETVEHLRTPPWFLLPVDLVMEIIPIPIPDNRERHYVLEPRRRGEPAERVNEITPALSQLDALQSEALLPQD